MHTSVLLKEVIAGLNLKEGMVAVDATVGAGGHSCQICQAIGQKGRLIGIDADQTALERSRRALKDSGCDFSLVEANFRDIEKVIEAEGEREVQAIIFDLGLSSFQLERSGRGFSFKADEPLLMTFQASPEKNIFTAMEVVNLWSADELTEIIAGFGGERYARRIVEAIVSARKTSPIVKARELSEIIEKAVPAVYARGKIHPATKTFQAIRMSVNDEINSLIFGLRGAWRKLSVAGRLAVISFHEGEDWIVKNFFNFLKKNGQAVVLTKKPITATRSEVVANPRSRSAKLRIIEKMPQNNDFSR